MKITKAKELSWTYTTAKERTLPVNKHEDQGHHDEPSHSTARNDDVHSVILCRKTETLLYDNRESSEEASLKLNVEILIYIVLLYNWA